MACSTLFMAGSGYSNSTPFSEPFLAFLNEGGELPPPEPGIVSHFVKHPVTSVDE
jgi:hypothetical protein